MCLYRYQGFAKRYNPSDKADNSVPQFCRRVYCTCVLCECEGGARVSEGEKVQSSACLSGHPIQHREKPSIQHGLPTPPSKLPSNSTWPEWTCWHSSTAAPPLPTPIPPLLSAGLCLLFSFILFLIPSILLSSLHICAFPFPSLFPSSISACHGTYHHLFLSLHTMFTLQFTQWKTFSAFFSTLLLSSYTVLLCHLLSSLRTTPFILWLINQSA